jgi:hypothetical protein
LIGDCLDGRWPESNQNFDRQGKVASMGAVPTENKAAHSTAYDQDLLLQYAVDAAQRTIIFLDTLRQRGNQYLEGLADPSPDILGFEHEILIDGETLPRPVNYWLARIVPPDDVVSDPRGRPFVVVDPRAGHGPGIGGFRRDSEVGVALREGHPCYFVGFRPRPVPGQTIEDIARAEAVFLTEVIRRHPEADGKPCVIGNCQAGWAVLMLAAVRPELFGPIFLAGSPVSYWAGVQGRNPLRYTGGLLGGTWLAALAGDLGGGVFDGAWLVSNFEGLNPTNTLWAKQYRVWANPDAEAQRYLGFEKWWGGHILLTAEEMNFIANQLFVGNKLSSSEISLSDGTRVDLRNIKSPIVVFCSHGDNITPPQQALGWILDLYNSVEDIVARGQTIVYNVHDKIGHLGIFVASSVAKKEHSELIHNIDIPELLPPGLYEVVLRQKQADDHDDDEDNREYVASFEARSLDDIRALGGNDKVDERRFAAATRLSDITYGMYETFVAPFLRGAVNEAAGDWMRRMHPLRLQFEMFSDRNPAMLPVAALAEQARAHRRPVADDNPWLAIQETWSKGMTAALTGWQRQRDALAEQMFLLTYGSPLMQAVVGLGNANIASRPRPADDPAHRELVRRTKTRLRSRIGQGGLPEAFARAVIYVRLAEREIDERALTRFRRIRQHIGAQHSLADFKRIVRAQFLRLLVDHRGAIRAIPSMLAGLPSETITSAITAIKDIVSGGSPLSAVGQARLAEVLAAFTAAIATPTQASSANEDAGEDLAGMGAC